MPETQGDEPLVPIPIPFKSCAFRHYRQAAFMPSPVSDNGKGSQAAPTDPYFSTICQTGFAAVDVVKPNSLHIRQREPKNSCKSRCGYYEMFSAINIPLASGGLS
jgi:hypothetical protein